MIIALKLRDRQREMESLKLALAIVCVMGLALVHVCEAQNSPQDFVDAHNKVRAKEGLGPMTWDQKVATFAENYAKQRVDCKLQHSDPATHPYGENLFFGPEATAATAVEDWYSEKENYDYNTNSCLKGMCGHYTQVVWRDSVRLGCGRVKCTNGLFFITCNYDPAGNWEGEKPY